MEQKNKTAATTKTQESNQWFKSKKKKKKAGEGTGPSEIERKQPFQNDSKWTCNIQISPYCHVETQALVHQAAFPEYTIILMIPVSMINSTHEAKPVGSEEVETSVWMESEIGP